MLFTFVILTTITISIMRFTTDLQNKEIHVYGLPEGVERESASAKIEWRITFIIGNYGIRDIYTDIIKLDIEIDDLDKLEVLEYDYNSFEIEINIDMSKGSVLIDTMEIHLDDNKIVIT